MFDELEPPSVPPAERFLDNVVAEGTRRRRIAARRRMALTIGLAVTCVVLVGFVALVASTGGDAGLPTPSATTSPRESSSSATTTSTPSRTNPAPRPGREAAEPADPTRSDPPLDADRATSSTTTIAPTSTRPAPTVPTTAPVAPGATTPDGNERPVTTPPDGTASDRSGPTTTTATTIAPPVPEWSGSAELVVRAPSGNRVGDVLVAPAGTSNGTVVLTNTGNTALADPVVTATGNGTIAGCSVGDRAGDAGQLVVRPGETMRCTVDLLVPAGGSRTSIGFGAQPSVPSTGPTSDDWPTAPSRYAPAPTPSGPTLGRVGRTRDLDWFGVTAALEVVADVSSPNRAEDGSVLVPAGTEQTARLTIRNVGTVAVSDLAATGISGCRTTAGTPFDPTSTVLRPATQVACDLPFDAVAGVQTIASDVRGTSVVPSTLGAGTPVASSGWPTADADYTVARKWSPDPTAHTAVAVTGATAGLRIDADVCTASLTVCSPDNDGGWAPTGAPPRGDVPTWRITISNNGAVDLDSVTVTASHTPCHRSLDAIAAGSAVVYACTAGSATDRPVVLDVAVSARAIDADAKVMAGPDGSAPWLVTAAATASATAVTG